MKIAHYAPDLTDAQWKLMRPPCPAASSAVGPPPIPAASSTRCFTWSRAAARGGSCRRASRRGRPSTTFFRRRCREGTRTYLNARLRAAVRTAAGKDCRLSAGILDRPSVKSDPHGGAVGYDAGKQLKGRKHHLLVDTLGLLLGVHVTPASTPEQADGLALLAGVLVWLKWFKRLWVDGGYAGKDFAAAARSHRPKLVVEVVKRSDTA